MARSVAEAVRALRWATGWGLRSTFGGFTDGRCDAAAGPNPFAKPSPPAAGTGKYAQMGFAYASGSGNSGAELGGGAAEAEAEAEDEEAEEEEEVVYDRLEGAFTGLGFSVQHHATVRSPSGNPLVLTSANRGCLPLRVHTRAAVTQNQPPASATGGSGEAPEEGKAATAAEAEAEAAATVLRQRAEAAELRAELAERQLAAANAALVAAGLLLSPTERIPSVSPPAAEAAGSAGSVGQAGTAAHEAPTSTVERATAELSSPRVVSAAGGAPPEESTEEVRVSAAEPSAQTVREASGSESDDEAEMDAVWMQAADELMAGSNSDDSDGSLVCAALPLPSLQASAVRWNECGARTRLGDGRQTRAGRYAWHAPGRRTRLNRVV